MALCVTGAPLSGGARFGRKKNGTYEKNGQNSG